MKTTLPVPRFNAAGLPYLEKMACRATAPFTRSYLLLPSSRAAVALCRAFSRSRTRYATVSTQRQPQPQEAQAQRQQRQQRQQKNLTIPYPSTTAYRTRPFTPPTISEIQANQPRTRTRAKFYLGTVTRVGTMAKTVQISQRKQDFDGWLKRHTQHMERILAHEPSGYLRAGDVVEFARFSPATMAERYESGKLDRRRGGVRFEVHRVVTPFEGPVRERPELPKEGELWDRFGDVEFERRRDELTRPWNKRDEKRRLGVLDGMSEAVQMEVERMRKQLMALSEGVIAMEQMEQQQQQMTQGGTMATEGRLEELSNARGDIAAQLLGDQSPSSQAEKI